MKIKLLFFTFLTSFISFSQSTEHVAIKGTKYSLIPPKDFVISSNFSGFQDDVTGSSILIVEIQEPVSKINTVFTPEALKSAGMKFISKEDVNLNEKNAVMLKVSQNANGVNYLKNILVFGDETKTIMVNGIYPENFKDLEKDIKKSILSVKYNEKQNDNPLEAANFTVDVSNTNFKFAKYLAGTLSYSEDGDIPTQKSYITIGNSLGNPAIGDKRQFSINRFKKLPFGSKAKIISTKQINIDTLEGFEIIGETKDEKNKLEKIYEVILFDESQYYIIVGVSSNDIDKNVEAFKKIALTFKRK